MYRFIQLQNGIKIGLFSMQDVKSVSLKALVTAGPIIETTENTGGSHFIEHIVLAGTKSYPDRRAFAYILEELGVSYNGYTSTQEMGFEFDVPYINIFKTLTILKEILFEPLFSHEIVEKERKVVLAELQDRSNSPDARYYDTCNEIRFREGHPLTRRIIGTEQVLTSITSDQLKVLHDEIFIPSNLYMCLVGNLDLDVIEKFLRETFEGYASTQKQKKKFFSMQDLSGYVALGKEDLAFMNVSSSLSFRGYPREMPIEKEVTLKMFSTMLAGIRTSILFQDVREKEGLVYNIGADWSTCWGLGTFSIAFESDASKIDRILEIIYEDIRKIKDKGFEPEMLAHMKNYFDNRMLLSFSTPWNINQWILDFLFNDEEVLFPEKVIEIGKAISHEKMQSVIHDILDFSTANIIMMGKLDGYDVNKTLKRLGSML